MIGLKTCNEHNLNKTTHALDKLYIRMMAFYGIPETSPRENGFYLFVEKYRTFFPSFTVIQTLFCFRRSEEVEQLLLESVLKNNLLAQYRSNYKSQLNLITVLNMFLEKNSPYTATFWTHFRIIFLIYQKNQKSTS
jgi:hypothetical protein